MKKKMNYPIIDAPERQAADCRHILHWKSRLECRNRIFGTTGTITRIGSLQDPSAIALHQRRDLVRKVSQQFIISSRHFLTITTNPSYCLHFRLTDFFCATIELQSENSVTAILIKKR